MKLLDLAPWAPLLIPPAPLHEGVIKVPPGLFKDITDYIARHVFWVIRDRFTPKVRAELPEHWVAFKAEMKRWGVTLPRTRYAMREDGVETEAFPFTKEGLPKTYQHLTIERPEILVALDWKGTIKASGNTLAQHRTVAGRKNAEGVPVGKRSAIIIFLSKARDINRIPSPSRQPEEIGYVLGEIMQNLRHELQHAVQFGLLQHHDKRQVEMLPGYENHGAAYYASPVEFDPQIADAVADFLQTYGVLQQHEGVRINLPKVIKSYIAATPSRLGDGFGTNAMFKALKARYPDRYRVAVRKFFTEVTAALSAQSSVKASDGSRPR